MNMLDPFEVAEIRVWPLNFQKLEKQEALELLAKSDTLQPSYRPR